MNIDAFYYLDNIRAIALALPGVTEAPCFGTPAFYVGKKNYSHAYGKKATYLLFIQLTAKNGWPKIPRPSL
jgi:hypothetical protein